MALFSTRKLLKPEDFPNSDFKKNRLDLGIETSVGFEIN